MLNSDIEKAPAGTQLLVVDTHGEYYLAEKDVDGLWLSMHGSQYVWEGSSEYGCIEVVKPIGWMLLPELTKGEYSK